jgi:hypothetical protein
MPVTRQTTSREWHKILTMAQNNGFPKHIIHELKKRIITNKTRVTQTQLLQQQTNRWVTFTFQSPPVHKVTNSFKKTGLKIAFCPTNTIFQQLTQKPKTITLAEYISFNVILALELMFTQGTNFVCHIYINFISGL